MTDNPYLEPPFTDDAFDWNEPKEMGEERVREQMKSLREAVEHHSHLYYVEFSPVISDSAYDEMFHRLESLEDYLGVDDENSPTQKVGTGRSPTESQPD